MSIYSLGFGPIFCLGDLRPFSSLAGFFGVMSTSPISAPGFARFRKFSPVPGSRPRGLRFRPDQKKIKNSLPAAAPRNRSLRRCKKSSIYAEKPLCIVHNGFFLYPSPNAFSYSSMRRFSRAQYRASSSAMSSRLFFCSIARPTSSAPARSLLIRW